MENNTVVASAIEESILRDTIVRVAGTKDNIESLMAECDDHAENGQEHKFWGTDDEGDSWRVHAEVAA
jgi:hypothetical protein